MCSLVFLLAVLFLFFKFITTLIIYIHLTDVCVCPFYFPHLISFTNLPLFIIFSSPSLISCIHFKKKVSKTEQKKTLTRCNILFSLFQQVLFIQPENKKQLNEICSSKSGLVLFLQCLLYPLQLKQ